LNKLVVGQVRLLGCPALNEAQHADRQAKLANLLAVELPATGQRDA
jgi:hypothetical protein